MSLLERLWCLRMFPRLRFLFLVANGLSQMVLRNRLHHALHEVLHNVEEVNQTPCNGPSRFSLPSTTLELPKR